MHKINKGSYNLFLCNAWTLQVVDLARKSWLLLFLEKYIILCLLVVKTDMSYQRPKIFVNVSNEKQVDKFSTTRDAGQLKLFITTVITFNLQSFFL